MNQHNQDIFQSFQPKSMILPPKSNGGKKRFGRGAVIAGGGVGFLAGILAMLIFFYVSILPSMLPKQERQTAQMPPNAASLPQATPYVRTPAPVAQTDRPVPTLGAATASKIDPNQADVAQVAEVVRHSVVGVITKQPTEFLDGDTEKTITIEVEQGNGSGIVVTENGYIMTNYHVIASGERVYVVLESGEELPAEVMGTDAIKDIAVLKIDREELTPIAVGDSQFLRVGERAIAIGNPMGMSGGSVTLGIISAVDRRVYISSEGTSRAFIQTDAAINPGNSGGALVNAKGELIGINTLKSLIAGYDTSGNAINAEGIGYAIPVDEALPIAKELIRRGRVDRPGIGITVLQIDQETAEKNDMEPGLLITGMVAGGPAEVAGLQIEDVIIGVDEKPITDLAALLEYIQSKKFDDVIVIEVMRGQEKKQFEVIVKDMNAMRTTANPNPQ